MSDVFISFIHEESIIAKAIQTCINRRLQPWLPNGVFLSSDDWQVFAGEIWLDRIKQELEEAKTVILMLSTESVKRPLINFEAGAAWLANKAVIPVCFNGLTKEGMPKPYSGMQGVNIPDDLYYLVRSVNYHVNGDGSSPLPFGPKDYEFQVVASALNGMELAPPFPESLSGLVGETSEHEKHKNET